MTVADGQREIRTAYLGGFMGQLVSGLLWLASASLATWGTPRQAILLLVVGGMFIFPLTKLGLLLIGHRASTSPGNPFNALAMQTAFIVPLCLPLVGAAALHKLNWFYPALMLVVGAHYLPFVFLYGMRMFAVLGGLMVVVGLGLGLYAQQSFGLGGWLTAAALLMFAVIGRMQVQRELAAAPAA